MFRCKSLHLNSGSSLDPTSSVTSKGWGQSRSPNSPGPQEPPWLEGLYHSLVGAGKLRGNAVAPPANHSTNPSVLSPTPLSKKKQKQKQKEGIFICIPTFGVSVHCAPLQTSSQIAHDRKVSGKSRTPPGMCDSGSWGFKKITTRVSGHRWECQRLPPSPRACRAAPGPTYFC